MPKTSMIRANKAAIPEATVTAPPTPEVIVPATPPATPPAPRAKTALEIWMTPIVWPSFEMAKSFRASPADQFGAPGSVFGAQFQILRIVRIATWLRVQSDQNYTEIDEQLFKLRSASARASQPQPGTKAWDVANEAFENTLGQVVADIEARLVRHFGGVPEVAAPAQPEPTPAPTAAAVATAEDAAKVKSTIFGLRMAGVTFSVDPATGAIQYYDPRRIATPEDREILSTFTQEVREVILTTHGANEPSLPPGHCTRTVQPHHPMPA